MNTSYDPITVTRDDGSPLYPTVHELVEHSIEQETEEGTSVAAPNANTAAAQNSDRQRKGGSLAV